MNIPEECDTIAYFTAEGRGFPLLYLAHLLQWARDAGVRLIAGAAVTGLRGTGSAGEVTLDDGSVLAAGARRQAR